MTAELGAVILASGHARRLGRRWPGVPKGMLPWDGVPMITRIVASLSDVASRITVVWGPPGAARDTGPLRTLFGDTCESVGPPGTQRAKTATQHDRVNLVAGCGRGSAIDAHLGLLATETQRCLVLPCDLAFDYQFNALSAADRPGSSGAVLLARPSDFGDAVAYGLDAAGLIVARRDAAPPGDAAGVSRLRWGSPDLARRWAAPTGVGIVNRRDTIARTPRTNQGFGSFVYDRFGAAGALVGVAAQPGPIVDVGAETFLDGVPETFAGDLADVAGWPFPRATPAAVVSKRREAQP